ncbi:hypothetical protein [Meiothermus sp.]|uniref:hypothetical protein n=1 Tax=Meiothermus sp. TaxID=1955249 RepID=UPI0021DEF1F0|nr:hypothetical protein [Meiothermus sp.]GIW23896.1 MAG: hypothetical protein KatS3mg069_0163 [Meiothermus sp.]
MESLGHYLLRGRIALPGGSAPEVFEGQDVRTGIEVLAFKSLPEEPPKQSIPHTLSWIDREEDAWIAEIPVGAVQTSWLAGRVELGRLLQWVKQLVDVLQQAQKNDIPIGYIVPELIWARGSRVWLGGVGVVNPGQKWDFAGLLNTVKVLAGDAYPALPWREALENYVTGQLDYAALMEQLEAPEPAQQLKPSAIASSSLEAAGASTPEPAQQLKPSAIASSSLEAAGASNPELGQHSKASSGASSSLEAAGASTPEPAQQLKPSAMASSSLEAAGASNPELGQHSKASSGASSSLEAAGAHHSNNPQAPTALPENQTIQKPVPEPSVARPAGSKSLKVQVSEPSVPAPATSPPRRIRIEERLEPPFEVVEPPHTRRRTLLWFVLVPLLLLAGGLGLWWRSRPPDSGGTGYPVEFRLQPPGPSASLVILEIPEGSKMPLNTEVAQLPGRVNFDRPGIYRIRVRVQGWALVESLIEVPNPGGVTIRLQ